MDSNLSLPSPAHFYFLRKKDGKKRWRKEKKRKRKRNQRESSNNGSLHSPTSPDLLTRMIDAVDQPSQAQTNQAFYSSQLVDCFRLFSNFTWFFKPYTACLVDLKEKEKKEKKEKGNRWCSDRSTYCYLHWLLTLRSIHYGLGGGSLFDIWC